MHGTARRTIAKTRDRPTKCAKTNDLGVKAEVEIASQVARSCNVPFHFGLRWRDLEVRHDIRVAAFLVTRIHRSRGVTVRGAIHDNAVRVQRAGIQHRVNLREGSAGRVHIHCAIDVVTGNARRRARGPRQVDRMSRCRRACSSQRLGGRRRLGITREGECCVRRSSRERAERDCERHTVARRDRHR